jgi:hypothetical protein
MNGQRQAISEAYLADEDGLLDRLHPKGEDDPPNRRGMRSCSLIAKVRASPHASGVDAVPRNMALSSDEGVMLMCRRSPAPGCPMRHRTG